VTPSVSGAENVPRMAGRRLVVCLSSPAGSNPVLGRAPAPGGWLAAPTMELTGLHQLELRAFLQAFRDALRLRRIRWAEVARVFTRTGVNALPIVLLVSFLTGLVIALESANPFSRYGAQLLIADTIGLAMTRELGPLMTAVVLSGRSASSFAAAKPGRFLPGNRPRFRNPNRVTGRLNAEA